MKKIVWLISLLLGFQGIYAQKGFNFGLNLSPIISSVRVDSAKKEVKSFEKQARMGFKGGVMVGIGFAENAGIQTGINVLLGGFTTKAKTTPAANFKYGLTAVEVPLLLKLRTNDLGSGIHAKGYFGGSFALNVGANVNSNVKVSEGMNPLFLDQGKNVVTKHFQPFYTWFAFGAGVDWDIEGVGTLDFALTYHLALSNFIKPNYEHEYKLTNDPTNTTYKMKPYENLRYRMGYFGINIGFWFPTGN